MTNIPRRQHTPRGVTAEQAAAEQQRLDAERLRQDAERTARIKERMDRASDVPRRPFAGMNWHG